MASPITTAQLAANRANALLSTGPRTENGKQYSSTNARTHGLTALNALLPFEDPAEYQSHHESYRLCFRPAGRIETEMVTELADIRWRLKRVPVFEAQLLNQEFTRLTTDPELKPLIEHLEDDIQIFALGFTRLVANRSLPNLHGLESRLNRRAEKLERLLAALSEKRQIEAISSADTTVADPAPQICKNEPIRVTPEPGRNEPCPCNSGLKYKRCCWLNKNPQTVAPALSRHAN